MKIAVCFIGMIRTGVYASENLKHWFGDLYDDIDFFIHTWDYSASKSWHPDSKYARDKNIIQNLDNIPVYPLIQALDSVYNKKIVSIAVENQQTFLSSNIYKNCVNFSPQWYSWYKAIQLANIYEENNNFQYDVIVKLRPDLIFPKERSLKEEINYLLEDTSYLHTLGYDPIRIDDVMFLANSTVMKESSKFFIDVEKNIWETNLLGEWLQSKNIKVKNTLYQFYAVYRKEHLDLGISPMKFYKCFNVERDYYAPYNIDRLSEDPDENIIC